MDFLSSMLEFIDMRSFSNLWYWIALAVVWSTTSHWVIGVPYDMIQKAARHGGPAQTDLEDLVRIYCSRLLYIAAVSGLWLLGFACFALTTLALLGFAYEVEVAQAVFLIAFPMSFVGLMSINTARVIRDRAMSGEDLRKRLIRHRTQTQFVGMLAIFVTSMWGMYQNLALGALG